MTDVAHAETKLVLGWRAAGSVVEVILKKGKIVRQ
jgi:hypothetical protein